MWNSSALCLLAATQPRPSKSRLAEARRSAWPRIACGRAPPSAAQGLCDARLGCLALRYRLLVRAVSAGPEEDVSGCCDECVRVREGGRALDALREEPTSSPLVFFPSKMFSRSSRSRYGFDAATGSEPRIMTIAYHSQSSAYVLLIGETNSKPDSVMD